MEKIVAIIDEMPEYAKHLAVYLNGRRNFPYRAVVFSDVTEVRQYAENDAVYAILAEERLEKEVLGIVAGTEIKLFLISETKNAQSATCLYRYNSAREIERRLIQENVKEKEIPVIGFFSPAGGAEGELLSRKIAERFGASGKVLYLSFFPFGIYGRECGDGMSELLFYVKQKKAELYSYFCTLLQKADGMDAVGPVRWYTDLQGITKEDIECLLRCIKTNSGYYAVVVGVGQSDGAGKAVLACCDKVIVPVWETEDGQRIQQEFLRQLKECGEAKLYSRIREITVRGAFPAALSEAADEAVRKEGEIVGRGSGGNTQTDTGTAGFVGGFDR